MLNLHRKLVNQIKNLDPDRTEGPGVIRELAHERVDDIKSIFVKENGSKFLMFQFFQHSLNHLQFLESWLALFIGTIVTYHSCVHLSDQADTIVLRILEPFSFMLTRRMAESIVPAFLFLSSF